MKQLCAECFAEFDAEAAECPACGASVAGLSEREYQEKLLRALDHRLADVRMRAIIALGLRQRGEVADALVACALRFSRDVVQGLEIVARLRYLVGGRPSATALETLATKHPAHAIRRAAASALRDVGCMKPTPRGDIEMDSCQFCSVDAPVLRSQLAFACFDKYPVTPGHLLILPYRHVATWFEATDAERAAVLKLLDEARRMLDAQFAPAGYNIGINVGEVAGQTIMHLHVHLIPRYRGDCADPRGGVRGVIPAKQSYPAG